MANGTIAFDTLTTSDQVKSGTEKSIDTSYIYNGVAKAWFACDNMAILDSLNSAGLTDNATGDLTLTVTNAMNNDDYSTGMGAGGSDTTDGSMRLVDGADGTTARTTSAIRLRQGYKATNLTLYDDSLCSIQFFGDLA